MADLHLATVWEAVADTVPDRDAVVHGGRRLSWGEYDEAAARLAAAFAELGLGPDSKIALYLYNGAEYLIAQYAGFKMRGVPINVNYRYLDDELRYLLDNADAEVLVFHTSLADRVERIRGDAPKLRAVIAVDDGGPPLDHALMWDDVIGGHEPMARIERPGDDVYMLYTGGTTGMPKGVMYRQGDFARGMVTSGFGAAGPPASLDELPDALRKLDELMPERRVLAACPFMHGTGMWLGAMSPHSAGGTTLTLEGRSFDPHELFRTIEKEGVTATVIVGDAFARPMVRALEEAESEGRSYDLSTLRFVISSGVMWSAEVKQALLQRADLTCWDGIGSTEAGSMGVTITTRGGEVQTGRFTMTPTTKVFTEDDREVQPGSGEVGMVATPGVSLGYFKDPDKTERTFRVIDGQRWCFAGDWARVEADGSLTLLGRGSLCINTGGEKVFPEEVEEVVKQHPGIDDCLVVGVPDERFGERVVAVAAARPGTEASEGDIKEWARERLAGYKLPRQVVFVDRVPRAPNGKGDYAGAREVALSAS